MTLISDPTDARALPPTESTGSKIKKALGPIGVIGVVILKFIAKIKFILPILLKTGGAVGFIGGGFARISGWGRGGGFGPLLVLHARGPMLVAKEMRLDVRAPRLHPLFSAVNAIN